MPGLTGPHRAAGQARSAIHAPHALSAAPPRAVRPLQRARAVRGTGLRRRAGPTSPRTCCRPTHRQQAENKTRGKSLSPAKGCKPGCRQGCHSLSPLHTGLCSRAFGGALERKGGGLTKNNKVWILFFFFPNSSYHKKYLFIKK